MRLTTNCSSNRAKNIEAKDFFKLAYDAQNDNLTVDIDETVVDKKVLFPVLEIFFTRYMNEYSTKVIDEIDSEEDCPLCSVVKISERLGNAFKYVMNGSKDAYNGVYDYSLLSGPHDLALKIIYSVDDNDHVFKIQSGYPDSYLLDIVSLTVGLCCKAYSVNVDGFFDFLEYGNIQNFLAALDEAEDCDEFEEDEDDPWFDDEEDVEVDLDIFLEEEPKKEGCSGNCKTCSRHADKPKKVQPAKSNRGRKPKN